MRSESSAPRAAVRLARVVEVGLSKVDLTPSQYRILMMLANGAAQASIMADHLDVSRPSVTAVVDGLVARGLVHRSHDERDRRRVGHTITDSGRSLLEEADASLDRSLTEILEYSKSASVKRVAWQGLEAWEQALDAFRSAKKARKNEAAQKPAQMGAAS